MERHEPTVAHLRERVPGPVVLWVLDPDEVPTALAVHHLLNTFHRHDARGVFVVHGPTSWATRRALQRYVEELALTTAWLVFDPVPGQLEAFVDRALVVLRSLPAATGAEVAGALADLVAEREAVCASG